MKQQLKVALLAYKDSWESGGSLRVAQLLSEHLPRDLVDAHLVFAYGEPGSVSRHSTRSVHHLKFQSSRDWRRFPEARSWLRKQNFDILHFIDSIHWLIALSLGLKTKRILHFHGTPDLSTMAWSDQLLGVCKRWVADAGIAITHGARRGVTRLGWMSPRKLHVIQNGVSTAYFNSMPSKQEAQAQLGIPVEATVFGAVARFNDGCGLMESLAVLQHLPEHWHLLLVGDGRIRNDLLTRAREMKLQNRLHLPGMLNDVRPAYAAMDCVIMLARYQSFCLMLAEAMLARRPIVGLQGAGEYTEREYPLITQENALLFPREKPWDPNHLEPEGVYQKLANQMVHLTNNPMQVRHMVNSGYEWVSTRFSAERQAARCLQLYRNLVS